MSTVLTRIAELLKMTEPASATGMLFVHGTSVPSDLRVMPQDAYFCISMEGPGMPFT
jgi:hypothetical protein